MQRIFSLSRPLTIGAITLAVTLSALAQDPLPWALRAHYTFTADDCTLDLSEDKSDLRLTTSDGTQIADGIGFFFKLGDGTELRYDDLGVPATNRYSNIDSPDGEADRYSITYPGKDGLQVVVNIFKPESWPYLVRYVTLTNNGTAPVDIASISPIVADSGVITGFSPEARYVPRKITMRESHPVFNDTGRQLAIQFEESSKNFLLAFGILPGDEATPNVQFTSYNGEWHGQVVSVFDPPRTLKPGESVSSDRVAITYGKFDLEKLDTYYSWALTMNMKKRAVRDAPAAWVTVPEGGSLSELLAAGERWSREGVRHALIPALWEDRPGSMDGASPRFPKNMGGAADQMLKAGLMPGITFDALSTDKQRPGTLASADGQYWINPVTPEGVALLHEKVHKIANWHFTFLAVANSRIPVDVLKAHGLTRKQADTAAFKIIQEAAGILPVYPVSEGVMGLGEDSWGEAGRAVTALNQYGAVPAPVRLSLNEVEGVSDVVLAAINQWPGVIELMGVPKAKGLKDLGTVVGSSRTALKQ